MIFIDTKSTDPAYNFGVEYYLASEKRPEETVFLLWRTKPTLMIGKYQNIYEEIDLEYAKEKGIDIIRRMSGGGTIYTDLGGWQFSFIERDEKGEIEFDRYIGPVVSVLTDMGVPALWTGRNDLTALGRKFSGNAQYKIKGSTVHHGSILFETDLEEIVRCCRVDAHKFISKSISSVRERVVNLSEFLPGTDVITFRDRFVDGILGKEGKREELTEEEKKKCLFYAEHEFRDPEKIYVRNPSFEKNCTGYLNGGKIEVSLSVKKNIITGCSVTGDFFGSSGTSSLSELLKGTPYDREAVKEKIESACLYDMPSDQVADVIFKDS